MSRISLTLILTLILSVFASAQYRLKVGSAAPAFAGTALDGTRYDSKELRGKVVVVVFWSTRCAICHREIPNLNRFAAKYGGDRVVLLALSMENEEKIETYLRSNPFDFHILPNSLGTLLKFADQDRNGNLDMGFPSFYVIDQDGVVQYRGSGYDKTRPLEAAVSGLLAK